MNSFFQRPHSSYSHRLQMSSSSGLGRTASAREARATTEERSLRGSSLYRQTSFTERSYMRRAESLSRQSSFSRYGGASERKKVFLTNDTLRRGIPRGP